MYMYMYIYIYIYIYVYIERHVYVDLQGIRTKGEADRARGLSPSLTRA